MAKINLLPWREELRKQKQVEFLAVLGMVVLAAAVGGFFWNLAAKAAVEDQKSRNSYIENQISQMEESIKEIEELQRRKDALVERMNVIQGLQGNRPTIVHVFEEFVSTLPDGVYYTAIKQAGNTFEVIGVAESNNRISNLMRAIDASTWFINPQLNKVQAKGTEFEFQMTVQLEQAAMPSDGGAQAEESADSGKGKSKAKKKN